MRIALVNPFDPLPGEGSRPGRYESLCGALVSRGHEITWYSSDFSHAFKRRRDAATIAAAARRQGLAVVLLPTRAYRQNVSLGRLRSHALLARASACRWVESRPPELVVASAPPPGLAWQAAQWARRTRAKFVLDVQDLWPETFRRFWPRGLGWLHGLIFGGAARAASAACRAADGITGVAEGYVRHAQGRRPSPAPSQVLHLGVDLQAFDAGRRSLGEIGLAKPPSERWLFLAGSLSFYLDLSGVLALMAELQRRRRDCRLMVVGAGPAEGVLRRGIQAQGLDNVTLLGYRPYGDFATLATVSDVGLCPIRADSFVFFPNRVFDYFAAGLPVLSTLPGELAEVLEEHEAGMTCLSPRPGDWADAVEAMLRSPPDPRGLEGRGAWVRGFDQRMIAARFAEFVESL